MPVKFPVAHLVADRDVTMLALDLEVSRRTVERWLVDGVNWQQADEFAARVLKAHPATVFGPEWCTAAGYDVLVMLPDFADDCTVIPTLKRHAPGQTMLDVA